uniref:Uncharacterized protein n=1 Tax=Glossina pallidipes TaxID=7398 RepID=A0A1A9ZI01_GLOPL
MCAYYAELRSNESIIGRTGMTESNNMLPFFINSLGTYANPKYNTRIARNDDLEHCSNLKYILNVSQRHIVGPYFFEGALQGKPVYCTFKINGSSRIHALASNGKSSLIQRGSSVLNENICALYVNKYNIGYISDHKPANEFNFTAIQLTVLSKDFNLCYAVC